MQVAGIGRVVFWEGGSLWVALITGISERHSHHAIQVSLPLSGKVQFQTDADGEWRAFSGAVITPHLAHAFRAPGRVVANILFEPESGAGRRIVGKYPPLSITELPPDQVHALAAPIARAYFDAAPDAQLIAAARQVVAAISGDETSSAATDVRVLAAIAAVRAGIDEPIGLSDLARKVGLSPGRFRHLFVAETGVSFRAFVLWERLNRALALGFAGASWTEAAHAANFADSAHLSRTCKRMFGFAPSGARMEMEVGRRQTS